MSQMDENKRLWGLLRRRQCLVPTWRGWLALLLSFSCALFLSVRHVYSFLAVSDPEPGGLLVIEGWASDYVFERAVADFKTNHYDHFVVTGGPIEKGAPFSEFKTFAEFGAATALKMGLSTNVVSAVPAPLVRQDRTYTAAVELRKWLRKRGLSPTKVNLFSVGPHARRSRLLLQKALGPQVMVGVVAVEPEDYDPKEWWRTSAGVRGAIGEALAYGYARLLFHPPKSDPSR